MHEEYYTITLGGIEPRDAASVLREIMKINDDTVVFSHLHTDADGDFSYSDALDLDAYFTAGHSAVIHSKTVCFEKPYPDAVTVAARENNESFEIETDIPEAHVTWMQLEDIFSYLTRLVDSAVIGSARISASFTNKTLFEYPEETS